MKRSKAHRKMRKRVRPLSQEIQETTQLLIATMGCLIIITSVSFLWIRGHQSVKGSQLQQLQLEHEELVSDNRELEQLVGEARSITEMDDSDQVGKMVKPAQSRTNYIGDVSELATR